MTATAPATPEAEVVALRAALAEAGYPDAVVFVDPEHGPTIRRGYVDGPMIPLEVVWRAFVVATPSIPVACWPCWRDGQGRDCTHDRLTSEWPEVTR